MPRKTQQETISFYMPEGYSEIIDVIVTKHHSSGRDHSIAWKIKYCTIIDYIVGNHLTLGNDDFVNVNQRTVSKIIGCNHEATANLFRNLIACGIIVPDKKMAIAKFHFENGKKVYTTEGKSYGFKIPDYSNKKIVPCGIIVPAQKSETLKTNKRKIIVQNDELKLYQKAVENIRIDTTNLNEIISEILKNKVSKVNTESKYKEYICKYVDCISNNSNSNVLYGGTLVPIELSTKPGTKAPQGVESDDKTIARIMRSVNIINSGQMIASRPTDNSRVYCDLTNMNRELRKAVRIDGKPLIGLDVRNSQPLIASYLFKKFYTDRELPIPADVLQYQKDCEQGIFYDDFMAVMYLPQEFRMQFKKDFFQKVFFDKIYKKTNLLLDLFIKKYPNVWVVVKDEKGGVAFSEDYVQFAQRLQEVEALIMFDTVNIGLIKQGIKCYNNYDSLYVNNMEDYETAKALTIEAFNSVGINPTINPEFYDVSEHQILDETEKEAVCQASEPEEEFGYLKQQQNYIIKEEFITPYDNSGNIYGHIEPFKYFGYTVQTIKYFIENYKVDEMEAQEIYHGQFKEIESMAV